MTVRFLEVAQQELDEAVIHYNRELPGLGNALLLEAVREPGYWRDRIKRQAR